MQSCKCRWAKDEMYNAGGLHGSVLSIGCCMQPRGCAQWQSAAHVHASQLAPWVSVSSLSSHRLRSTSSSSSFVYRWEDFKPDLHSVPSAPALPPLKLPPFRAPLLDSELPFLEPDYAPVPDVPDAPPVRVCVRLLTGTTVFDFAWLHAIPMALMV